MTDAIYIAVIFFLFLIIIFQQIFWSRVAQKLVDKLMSRNYHEYVQAQQTSPAVRVRVNDSPDDFEDLSALNGGI